VRARLGSAVTAWAVQKSKFSEWTHRHTRADDVVAEIMDSVHDANATTVR
jgi:hypothetical protein